MQASPGTPASSANLVDISQSAGKDVPSLGHKRYSHLSSDGEENLLRTSNQNSNSQQKNEETNSNSNILKPHYLSETDAFLGLFTSMNGQVYKVCPKRWTVNDVGFGPDMTCCDGDCQPLSMNEIKKIIKPKSERPTSKEYMLAWARSVGKQNSNEECTELDQIPQPLERAKLRSLNCNI